MSEKSSQMSSAIINGSQFIETHSTFAPETPIWGVRSRSETLSGHSLPTSCTGASGGEDRGASSFEHRTLPLPLAARTHTAAGEDLSARKSQPRAEARAQRAVVRDGETRQRANKRHVSTPSLRRNVPSWPKTGDVADARVVSARLRAHRGHLEHEFDVEAADHEAGSTC